MRVGYARVSTDKREQDISIEGQEQQLLAYGCDRVIVERGSAYKGRRKGWEELWVLVASGAVKEVVTVDQSRLSRSGDDLEFLQACAIKGVAVRGLTGGVMETDSYAGFVTAGVLSVMNRAHSKLIAAKVRDGLARRRQAGFYGSGKVPFGYAVTDGQVHPHPEHFEAARVMWDQLVEMEMNVTGWIRHYGMPWTPVGVRKWIDNPMLRGAVRGKWGSVEPLVSWQEWAQAGALLKVRSGMRGRVAHRFHLFTGLVKCEQCGKSLHNVIESGRHPRLKCMSPHCSLYGRGLRVAVVRSKVIAALTKKHQQMAALAAESTVADTPEQQQIKAEIATLEQVAHLPGVADLISQQQAQLAAMKEQPAGPRLELLSELFADPATLELATDKELRAIVIEFVQSLVWPGGLESLEITLR